MILNSDYTYLFLDFETTGLDITSDYPIQIALILVDHNFQILTTYNHYITVPDSVLSLKANVSYMTGIDMEMIKKEWKDISIIQQEITDFFGDTTIIIGQNISFDLWFLKKFFPDCRFKDSIDTYPLATSMIPYLKSYSLEFIDNHLSTTYHEYNDRKSYLLTSLSTDKAISSHDALYDCIVGLSFIQRWTDQYQSFAQEFPILTQSQNKFSSDQFSIFDVITPFTGSEADRRKEEIQWSMDRHNQPLAMALPTLSSPLKSDFKTEHITSTNREKVPNHSKRSTKGLDLATIINELPHPCIIAVSHTSKIDIIKRACSHESFNYLKEEQILDHDKLNTRLHKKERASDELLFVIFYLAHHRDGYRVLNPILPTHKYILDYLQGSKPLLSTNKKILCSHGWLYYTMSNKEYRDNNFAQYPICLLDADRRHTTYNDFAQKWINLNSTLSQREKVHYMIQQEKDETQQEVFWQFLSYRELLIGYFGIESEKYLWSLQKLEVDYFAQNKHYSKTNGIRTTIKDERKNYHNTYEDHPQLNHLITKLDHLFNNPLIIRRMTNNTKDISYTIAPSVRYIDFAEYLKLFGDQQLSFFSSTRSEYNHRLPADTQRKTPQIFEIDNIEKIKDTLTTLSGSSFVISHNGEKSKKLFHLLHNSEFKNSHKLIAEYLTGGIGKITSLVDSDKQNILIWWYHMLLQLRAQGKTIDNIIILYIHQGMKTFIQEDIKQYALMK